MSSEPVGRIQTASTRIAYVDVDATVREGDVVAFTVGDARIRARVANLQTGAKGRNVAHVEYLDATSLVPQRGTPVLLHKEDAPGGLDFQLGHDVAKRPVVFRLNALFRHVLIAGMTQQGKTHLEIALLEAIAQWGVPVLIVDSQAEFRNLSDVLPKAVCTEDEDEALAHLRQRKIVVLDLQASTLPVRRAKVADALRPLFERQEAASAKGKPLPPVLVFLDEADAFAPSRTPRGTPEEKAAAEECRVALVEIAKRGSKLGLGLVLTTQRPASIHIDVRSQLNGAFFFRLTDQTSRTAMRDFGLTSYDAETVQRLQVGEALVAGLVPSPTRMHVRRINTPRVRSTDFENLLQAIADEEEEAAPDAGAQRKGAART